MPFIHGLQLALISMKIYASEQNFYFMVIDINSIHIVRIYIEISLRSYLKVYELRNTSGIAKFSFPLQRFVHQWRPQDLT